METLNRGLVLPPHSRMVIAEKNLAHKHFRYTPELRSDIRQTFARAQREIEAKREPT